MTHEAKQKLEEQGYLVFEDFVSKRACEDLRERALSIVDDFDPNHSAVFSPTASSHDSDVYFLESGDKIRCFFEEEAWSESGDLKQEKGLSIHKIGHAMHDLDPVFQRFSYSPAIEALVRSLGFEQPQLLQSMYMFKQPLIGSEVKCHQDSTFLYTEPIRLVGLWFALERATVENGCLWVLPGGHKEGLKSRFRKTAKYQTTMEVLDNTPWNREALVPVEVPQGALVVLHGLLPHLSYPNRSERSRHAYTLHVIDGVTHYPADNWLQRNVSSPFQRG